VKCDPLIKRFYLTMDEMKKATNGEQGAQPDRD